MESVISVVKWFIQNYQTLVAGAIMVLSGLAILARTTKNPKDDSIIAKLLEWLRLIPTRTDGTIVTKPPLNANYYSVKYSSFYKGKK